MTVSVYKEREIAGRTPSSALPKINVRPSSAAPQFPSALFEPTVSSDPTLATAGHRPRAKDWDAGFAAALILIVVAVNATLTGLLGGDPAPTPDSGAIVMQPAATAHSDAKGNETAKVYISSEEKRLLLRHLYKTAPAPQTAPPPVRGQGTYRSVSDRQKDALSITGAPATSGPQ